MKTPIPGRELVWHAVFWCVYFVLFYTLLAVGSSGHTLKTNHIYLEEMVFIVSILFLVYSNILFLIPRFFKASTLHWFVLLTAGIVGVYCGLRLLIVSLSHAHTEPLLRTCVVSCYVYLTHFPIALGYCMGKRTVLREKEKAQLEREKARLEAQKATLKAEKLEADKLALESEVAYLRMQFSPHFMYNTLSTLYYQVSLINEPISENILRFCQLMQYSLRDGTDQLVSLSEEIEHLDLYLALHQMQHGTNRKIDMRVEGNTEEAQILPLILIHFLENAFKHGDLITEPLTVQLTATPQQVRFYSRNRKARKRLLPSTGIGRKNTQRRLELAYRDAFTLHEQDEGEYYTTELIINQRCVSDT